MSQIVDTHTHFCSSPDNYIPASALLEAMKQNGISYALTANLAGCEYDSWHRPRAGALDQITNNNCTADAVEAAPGNLGGLFWVKPGESQNRTAAMELLKRRRNCFFALKFHPYYSATKVTDPLCTPWFDFAVLHRLPVVIHTDWDEWSNPQYAAERAAQYPQLPIVMIHTGLWGGPEQALGLMQQHPNLYGDLTWLRRKAVRKILGEGDTARIMFGSDALIAGEQSYNRAMSALSEINRLSEEKREAVLNKTARRVFKLPDTLGQH